MVSSLRLPDGLTLLLAKTVQPASFELYLDALKRGVRKKPSVITFDGFIHDDYEEDFYMPHPADPTFLAEVETFSGARYDTVAWFQPTKSPAFESLIKDLRAHRERLLKENRNLTLVVKAPREFAEGKVRASDTLPLSFRELFDEVVILGCAFTAEDLEYLRAASS